MTGWLQQPEGSAKKRDAAIRKRIYQERLDLIAGYIATQAACNNIDIRHVPCPSKPEWAQLAGDGGRHAQLPPTSLLTINIPDSLRAYMSRNEITDPLVGWFMAARSQLIAARAKAAAEAEAEATEQDQG